MILRETTHTQNQPSLIICHSVGLQSIMLYWGHFCTSPWLWIEMVIFNNYNNVQMWYFFMTRPPQCSSFMLGTHFCIQVTFIQYPFTLDPTDSSFSPYNFKHLISTAQCWIMSSSFHLFSCMLNFPHYVQQPTFTYIFMQNILLLKPIHFVLLQPLNQQYNIMFFFSHSYISQWPTIKWNHDLNTPCLAKSQTPKILLISPVLL